MNPNTERRRDSQVVDYRYTADVRDEAGRKHTFTPKEALFVFHYLETTNFAAGKAVEAAGYAVTSIGSAYQMGAALMRRPHIRAAINQAFEVLTFPKYETLFRLARIAAGSIDDVLNDDGEFDIDAARKADKMHLLKKVKITRTRREVKSQAIEAAADGSEGELIESSILDEKIEFEIHDPIRALELIGKHERLFVDRIEATGKDGRPLIPEDAGRVVVYLPDNGRGDAGKPPIKNGE